MKILFLITSTGIGGAEKVVFKLAQHAQNIGIDTEVCSLKQKGPYAITMEANGIKVSSLNMSDSTGFVGILSFLLCLPKLIKKVRLSKPDLIHSHLFRANLAGRITARACTVPVNISTIHGLDNKRNYYHALNRWTDCYATEHVAVSESLKEVTAIRSGIDRERIRVIYNGVDFSALLDQDRRIPSIKSGKSSVLCQKLGVGLQDKVVGTVARLNQQKGLSYLIEAIALLARKYRHLKLLLVGDGPERARLESLARQFQISENVIFAGLQMDPMPYLRLMDAFVLPSLSEGLPLAVLEAISVGVPVIATSVGGIPEVVIHGQTGFLVEPKNVNAIANELQALLNNTRLCESLVTGAWGLLNEKFSEQKMLDSYCVLYWDLLNRKKGSSN